MRRIVLCAAVLAAVIGFLGGIGPSYAAAEYVLQVVGADGAVSRSVTWQDAEGRAGNTGSRNRTTAAAAVQCRLATGAVYLQCGHA